MVFQFLHILERFHTLLRRSSTISPSLTYTSLTHFQNGLSERLRWIQAASEADNSAWSLTRPIDRESHHHIHRSVGSNIEHADFDPQTRVERTNIARCSGKVIKFDFGNREFVHPGDQESIAFDQFTQTAQNCGVHTGPRRQTVG